MSQAPPQPLPAVVIPPPLPPASAAPPAFPQAAQVIPYATPYGFQAPAAPEGMWRDGRTLVTLRNVAFPCRCVKCNAPVSDYRWDKTLHFTHPALLLVILIGVGPGILLYLLLSMCLRSSARIKPPLCGAHRPKWKVSTAVAWLLAAAGISTFILGLFAAAGGPLGTFNRPAALDTGLGLLMFFAGIVWARVRGRVLVATNIDVQQARFAGAGRAFLDSLSEMPTQLAHQHAAYIPPAGEFLRLPPPAVPF
jgi:hypothetical protein